MANFETSFERLLIYFQGGVRRSVVIFCGASLVLSIPIFFLGQGLAGAWNTYGPNPINLDTQTQLLNTVTDLTVSGYTISRTQSISLVTGETVFYVSINNKASADIGYFPFVYDISLLDSKNVTILQKTNSQYLLPGETKYIVVNSSNEDAQNLKISPIKSDSRALRLNDLSKTLKQKVNLEIRNAVINNPESSNEVELSFLVKNQDIVKIKTAELTYVIRDDRDRVVGIGQYQIQNLKAGEERPIQFKYPKSKTKKATRLTIDPQVNYLDENNIVLE